MQILKYSIIAINYQSQNQFNKYNKYDKSNRIKIKNDKYNEIKNQFFFKIKMKWNKMSEVRVYVICSAGLCHHLVPTVSCLDKVHF